MDDVDVWSDFFFSFGFLRAHRFNFVDKDVFLLPAYLIYFKPVCLYDVGDLSISPECELLIEFMTFVLC